MTAPPSSKPARPDHVRQQENRRLYGFRFEKRPATLRDQHKRHRREAGADPKGTGAAEVFEKAHDDGGLREGSKQALEGAEVREVLRRPAKRAHRKVHLRLLHAIR